MPCGTKGWHTCDTHVSDVILRHPEATSLGRIKGFNQEAVTTFFNSLGELMEKHSFTPDHIFNVDEIGVMTVQKPSKILAQRGQRQVGNFQKKRECEIYMKQSFNRQVSVSRVAELFHMAYRRIASILVAENGFRKCGIVPFNPDIFDDSDFLPSKICNDVSDPHESIIVDLDAEDEENKQLEPLLQRTEATDTAIPSCEDESPRDFSKYFTHHVE